MAHPRRRALIEQKPCRYARLLSLSTIVLRSAAKAPSQHLLHDLYRHQIAGPWAHSFRQPKQLQYPILKSTRILGGLPLISTEVEQFTYPDAHHSNKANFIPYWQRY